MHKAGLAGIFASDFSRGFSHAQYYEYTSSSQCNKDSNKVKKGCLAYIKYLNQNNRSYSSYHYSSQTFHGYDCMDDCSGHISGYKWAEENGISESYDCNDSSKSFNEGCIAYVDEY